jgi:predicted dehydrogenase
MSTAGLAAASFPMAANAKEVSANEKIRIGVMGLGGRNIFLIKEFLAQPEFEVTHICDCDTRKFETGMAAVLTKQQNKPVAVQDFRRMLDNKDVDVILNSAGSHWHPLGTIMACQAGKDVYVEKPLSHDIFESGKMVEAARKYNRVVQVGSQNTGASYIAEAIDFIRQGGIGKVHFVRALNMLGRRPRSKAPYPAQPIPSELDYDMWCGPAPKLDYNPSRTTKAWRYFYEYSGGDSESIHSLDIARWVTGKTWPKSVNAVGDLYVKDVNGELPDTLTARWQYDDCVLGLDLTWWTRNWGKTPVDVRFADDKLPTWFQNGCRVEAYGEDGMVFIARHGGGWQAWDKKGKPTEFGYGIYPVQEHITDFKDAIKTRRKPRGDIEIGHISQSLVNMAYIAHRVGNKGLKWDTKNMKFADCSEANALLKRPNNGRKPWRIPDEV